MEGNPYASPEAESVVQEIDPDIKIAERGSRLVAVILDSLIYFACALPAIIGFFAFTDSGNDAGMTAMIAISGIAGLAIVVYNLILIAKVGQTLGKKIMKIKIVDFETYEHPGFARIFFLRGVVMAIINMIPVVGHITSIVDPLLIFRKSNQCLHDQIANTIVINA